MEQEPIAQTYLLNYTFNQDGSCFSLATSTGFRTFTISPLSEISRRTMPEDSAVAIATMLFQTNYLALVLKSQPYRVLLWDDSLRQKPHEIWSRYEVLNVLLRRDVLVVVSEYKIYIYEFGSFQVLMHLETASNARGVAALAPGGSRWVLVCPGSTAGTIKIQTGADQSAEIAAHSHSIAAIAINPEGTLVATASEQGTVIKVFSIAELRLIFSFRRGTTTSLISSLAFRPDSKFLAVASASSATVHVFRLLDASHSATSEAEEPSAAGGLGRVAAAAAAGLAPGYFAAERSFCQFRLSDVDGSGRPAVDLRLGGGGGASALCGPTVAFGKGRVFVLHYNGVLYEGEFDENAGGAELGFARTHVVFAARPEFRLENPREEDAWQVV